MEKKIKKILVFTMFLTVISYLIPITFSKYKNTFSKDISLSVTRAIYTIKFNSNGGTGEMSDISVKYAVSQNLPSNSFTKSGYLFIGWNTKSDGSGRFFSDEQDIAYATTINGDEITLYAQWFNKDYLNDSMELNNYTCTESVETFVAPKTGDYVLEAWGAQGGSVSENSSSTRTIEAIQGGRGGYSYGVIHLNVGDEIYVAVGCEGKELKNSSKNSSIPGGYNGGGGAISDGTSNYQGSGGGATHFAINQNLGELKNYENNQDDILIVAGGGGGSYSSLGIYYYSIGGSGGGINGGDAITYYVSNFLLGSNSFMYYQGLRIPGADQSTHVNDEIYYGSFGLGTGDDINNTGTDAGAGGGWYGGNKLARLKSSGGMAGSGGSGHINTSELSEGSTLAGNVSVPTHDGSSYMTGNTGDGYARISLFNPEYTVKFDANGGSGVMNDITFISGDSQNITSNSFTKTRYIFDGWNTKADGTGTSYVDGVSVSNLNFTSGTEIILYAQWKTNYIFFQLPPDWNGTNVYVYLFNDTINNGWPGYTSTLVDSTKKIYGYELSSGDLSTYTSLILANGDPSSRQTVDITFDSSFLGKVYVPALYSGENQIRVFFQGSKNWDPYIYLWKDGTDTNNGWPGVVITTKINSTSWSTIIDTKAYDKMIFDKGKGGTGNQSSDLSVPSYQDLTYNLSSGPYRFFYFGGWHNYDAWVDSEYNTWNTTGDGAKFRVAQSVLGY